MKEQNKPEEKVEVKEEIKVEKKDTPRPYIALPISEINELLDDYRKILRKESGDVAEIVKNKILQLERELKRRSISVKTSQS